MQERGKILASHGVKMPPPFRLLPMPQCWVQGFGCNLDSRKDPQGPIRSGDVNPEHVVLVLLQSTVPQAVDIASHGNGINNSSLRKNDKYKDDE